MSKEISAKLAKQDYGISTFHTQEENGELRFRLKKSDGTAYIRTEADATGGWQNSHYHKRVMETYVVQSGWMAFAELIEGTMKLQILNEGDQITTRPTVIHNVYLPAFAVIHTVKHGRSIEEDRNTDGDCASFNLITQAIEGDSGVRAASFNSSTMASYSDAYRHFDMLIWQLPALSTTIFVLSMNLITDSFDKYSDRYGAANPIGYLLLALTAFMICFWIVLWRFRRHQGPMKSYSRTPIWKSASAWAQSIVLLQSMIFFGVGLLDLGVKAKCAVGIAGVIWLFGIVIEVRSKRASH